MSQNNGRKSDGTFGKGNQCAKKDFTKEMATHVTAKELYWTSNMLAKSIKELKAMQENGTLGDESIVTYSILTQAIKGNFKPVQFLIEMILGRPKQQIESDNNNTNKNIELAYRLDDK